jgi:hypothetical protein
MCTSVAKKKKNTYDRHFQFDKPLLLNALISELFNFTNKLMFILNFNILVVFN